MRTWQTMLKVIRSTTTSAGLTINAVFQPGVRQNGCGAVVLLSRTADGYGVNGVTHQLPHGAVIANCPRALLAGRDSWSVDQRGQGHMGVHRGDGYDPAGLAGSQQPDLLG